MKCCFTTVRGAPARWSRVLYWTSWALVILFGVAEIHEFFPFLHDSWVPGNIAPDSEECPWCVIKYALSLALWLFPAMLLLILWPQAKYRFGAPRIASHEAAPPSSRGPPFLYTVSPATLY